MKICPLEVADQVITSLAAAGKLDMPQIIPLYRTLAQELDARLSECVPREVHEPQEPASNASQQRQAAEPAMPVPPLPPEKSITPDRLICLEDGVPRKMLRRYLRAKHNLTPEQYRAKWGLPSDYPMVAPRTRTQRSAAAKLSGLGTHDRNNKSAP